MARRYWSFFAALSGAVVLLVTSVAAQDGGSVRAFTVVGDHYAFTPSTISVKQGDTVKITFTAKDIPHSFTIDSYRIAKRAAKGGTITFEFLADQAGSVPFYCNLTLDPKCRDMKGTLTVR